MIQASALRSGTGLNDLAHKAGSAMLGGLTFTVDRGMHAGACLTSHNGEISVGSGLDNDIVLIADHLAAQHVKIALTDPWRQRVRIDVNQQPITLQSGKEVQAGHFVDLPLPLRFRAGTAECRLEAVRQPRSWLRFAVPAAAILIGLFLLSTLYSVITSAFSGSSMAPPPSVTTSASPSGPMNQSRWQVDLNTRLINAGLQGQIAIEKGGTGNLVAVGVIDDALAEKWRDVLKWYDAQGAGPLLVNNVTRGTVQTNLPNFRTVWLDTNPQVILSNGQAAGIGETIPGGWKIEAIEPAGVLLSRDGRSARVTF